MIALALLLALASPVAAETEVDAYGLGSHPPKPEHWAKIDDDLSIRARVVHDASGALADVVPRREVLRLELAFFAREGAADRDVSLHCKVHFVDATAESSDFVKDVPCYKGRLLDAEGTFQPLDLDLRFRPVASDPAGTSAVMVRVNDSVVKDGVTLWATYDWQGGKR
ncbi:hypothetical protein [Cypionkella aquatica]|uniref:hypothetical protein n=1 Tax=Cypionkella aquatica TaxID=1756042 RepID=UPI0024E0E754|nr:hypothetical protein [Cypionkella aquatica]